MTVRRITISLQTRTSPVFDMDLTDTEQARNIGIYLDRGEFPELELIHLLVRAVQPGDYVVDCGACTGFFTLLMGALGAYVTAIEPGTNNLPELYHNVCLNGFSIDVRPVALGNKNEVRDLLLIDDGGANSFTQPEDRQPGKPWPTDVRCLPGLLHKSPKLIKMDIEGSEFDVLENWLAGPWTCPYIAVEYNLTSLRRSGHTGDELRAMMYAAGYQTFVLFADGMIPMLVPRNTTAHSTRQNVNVLFAKADDVGLLWPELLL